HQRRPRRPAATLHAPAAPDRPLRHRHPRPLPLLIVHPARRRRPRHVRIFRRPRRLARPPVALRPTPAPNTPPPPPPPNHHPAPLSAPAPQLGGNTEARAREARYSVPRPKAPRVPPGTRTGRRAPVPLSATSARR